MSAPPSGVARAYAKRLEGETNGDAAARIDAPRNSAHELEFHTLSEFVERPKLSTHVRGLIPARSIVMVFGPPKGGKTFSVTDLALHAAHGMDWHGFKVARKMRVAYLAGEGVNGLRVRLKAWLEHHESITEHGHFFVLPAAFSIPGEVLDLTSALLDLLPDILVVDTVNSYFGGGDENSTQDMTQFCAAVRSIRDAVGCSIIVIHHTGQGESGRERGSIVLRATADVIIQVAKGEGDDGLVGFQVIAARDLEPMEEPLALRLVHHVTEWADEDGTPISTCIVEAANRPVTLPGRRGRSLGPAQLTVLQAAQELAKAAPADPSGEVFLARMDIAALAKERGVSKQAVSTAWKPIAQRGFFRLVEPGSIAIRLQP